MYRCGASEEVFLVGYTVDLIVFAAEFDVIEGVAVNIAVGFTVGLFEVERVGETVGCVVGCAVSWTVGKGSASGQSLFSQ